ncbi:MAG TPA: hypothetical protein VMM12_17925 [Longimicrobiales bacterium]|nr:hypothetical protein [Longimicrobiales bacterium]
MKRESWWRKRATRRGTGSGAARTSLLFAVGAVVATGCDDPMSTERSLQPQAAMMLAEADAPPRFTANGVQYRNSSAGPAVGRAGSATLTGNVLLDVTAMAELYLAAGTIGGDGTPLLGQVQIKAFAADGRLLFTRNDVPGPDTRRADYVLGPLSRDARVQVQANVTGADPVRTGVVTLDVPVRLRPDPQVAAIAAPQRVGVRTMVGIAATVRELNGDLGARADCALVVGGVEVDRARGIWVDAGSSVSCAFRHRFEALGPTEVEVRLVDVEPRDFDADNNAARTTVEVMLIPSAFAYDASFQDVTFESSWRSEYRWQSADGRYGSEGRDQSEASGREQSGLLWAWTPRALAFPLDELIIRQMTRDETVHAARFLAVEPDWSWSDEWGSQSCFMRWFDTPNGYNSFELCSVQWQDSEPYTYLHYSRHAGEVTYHSRGDSRWWDQDAGVDDVWSWNYSDSFSIGRMVSYGREYGFFIRMQDANGVYRMQPLVWLEPFSEGYQTPWSCWEDAGEWGSYHSCHESRWAASGLREWVSGWPTY